MGQVISSPSSYVGVLISGTPQNDFFGEKVFTEVIKLK